MSDKHVELSTVFFYPKGERPPSKVNLSECGPPMLAQNDDSITCLYGLRHRRLGFKQIHDFAEKNNLDYEVVDMKLPVREAPSTVNREDLGAQEVLSLARISGDVKQMLYEGMNINESLSRTEQQTKLIEMLSSNKDAINTLRDSLHSNEVPLVIHPTRLSEGEESIAVANLAKSSCSRLVGINCRTKKGIEIVNDLGSPDNEVKDLTRNNSNERSAEVVKKKPKG
ncbi:hypothetical protein [Halomonas campaniensis]|uniref:Uncharacterized protein n=1 Tax=Halomonas campaniensis TaxID=213554 RepID=A0A246S461_9GAMM|nr:hypothetical protein [Halomonas campaniensis]OWV31251.1 hypothetical protein JI62_02585 [Halomonas campaniensis]